MPDPASTTTEKRQRIKIVKLPNDLRAGDFMPIARGF
jgi:hypothetical protein